ncbi:MAG: DUF4337 domain-containing protein [Bryobacteraceae bacterium]|jgi:hypothetical protein
MAELEIHHEGGHNVDPMGQRVGVLAALLAVALAIVTIVSHRTHTEAIMQKSAANDAWAHYQSTRVKYHNLELGQSLIGALGAKGATTEKLVADYGAQEKDYEARGRKIQEEAERDDGLAESAEHRALRYDLGEGLLEIGLVLSSLYFISRKRMFPVIGIIAGIAGVAIAVTGLLA